MSVVARHRLAFGLEPRDALGGGRIPPPLAVQLERPLPGAGTLERMVRLHRRYGSDLPPLDAHDTGRFVLRWTGLEDAAPDTVAIRLVERVGGGDPRRFVPRRMRLPLGDPGAGPVTGARVRRPRLFPGAAYPLASGATGLRGRVLREGQIAPWARVEALRPDSDEVLARAHGDDRGEFLLVLGPQARGVGELTAEVTVELRVFLPDPAPVANPPALAEADGLWALPVEEVPAGAFDDPVTLGEALPDGYSASVSRELTLPLGGVRTAVAPFEF